MTCEQMNLFRPIMIMGADVSHAAPESKVDIDLYLPFKFALYKLIHPKLLVFCIDLISA